MNINNNHNIISDLFSLKETSFERLNSKKYENEFRTFLYSLNTNDNSNSELLEQYLVAPVETISKNAFDLIKPNLNVNAYMILKEKNLSNLSKRFSIYFRQFEKYYNDFNFFGLTVSDFSVIDKDENYCQSVLLSKLTDYKLINKKLNKIYIQQLELQQIKRGNVKEYMSDITYSFMSKRKVKSDQYLSNKFISVKSENGDIEEKTLLELQDLSKKNKMNELSVIKNYVSSLINDGTYGFRFITVTNTPDELPRSFNSSDKTHWNGISTPSDNAKQLQKRWRNIQAYANKNDIPLVGVWCREPHKKGGIHQHLLVITKLDFLEKDQFVKKMTKNQTNSKLGLYKQSKNKILSSSKITLEQMFLKTFGYTNRSCKIDVLTGGKNLNVLNYITKYIMKTIDLKDYNGTNLKDDQTSFNKISFHRSVWSYRAYGFFGFKNALGKWRFLRKVNNNISRFSFSFDENSIISKALELVKNNDYSNFMKLSDHFDFVSTRTFTKHGEKNTTKYAIIENDITYVYSDFVLDDFDLLKTIQVFKYLDFQKYQVYTK